MKNFVRALRYAWPYRGRLVLSIVFALLAAILWSLNFTAITPVLTILTEKKSLQEWVDGKLDETEKDIKEYTNRIDRLARESESWADGPASDYREKRIRELASELARFENKLQDSRTDLYRFAIAKKYIYALLPTDPFQTLACVIGLVVLGVAVKGLFEFGQESLVGSVVNLSLFDLRNRFYRNVIRLDVGQFSDNGTGEVMARFTNDMELLGNGTKVLFGRVIAEPLRALACVLIACWISWQLTLMFLVLVPAALFILTKVGRMMKRASRRLLEHMSNIYKILQETFQGIRVVKACTTEPRERRRFYEATREYCRKAMRVVNIDALSGPVIELLGVVAVVGALLVGAYLVLTGHTHLFGLRMTSQPLTAATLLQLYALLAAVADPVRKLSSVYTKLQSGAAAADRIFNYADRTAKVQVNAEGPRLLRHSQGIEFRDVCFSYEPGRPTLTNVHLEVRYGETIALVGRNGSGKTTLLGLLPRFYDPDHGTILIDGLDIRGVHLRSLRKQVGLVTQETILFDDTIHNNIAYGARKATRTQVEDAARRAFAHDFIARLEAGYDTRVGEAGAKLSGGQKQRLALARAILRDPSILILDEFTSQYDAESEALIHRALRDFMKNRTTFVITHRLNTLEVADRIVVLDHGRITAVGRHAELLAHCPVYQRLHEAQFQQKVA